MKVLFSKKYNYGAFLNLDVGAEGESKDTKESLFAELDKLHGWCNEWFETRYPKPKLPEVNEQRGTIVKDVSAKPKKALSQTESIIEDINTCNDLKVLETYGFISKSKPEIKDAYEERLKQLKTKK